MNKNLIIIKWNSLLLSIASIITGAVVLYYTHKFTLPLFMILSAIIKLVGIAINSPKMRLRGLVGLNISWLLFSVWMFSYRSIFALLAGWLAIVVAGFGFGVSVQERFDEH